MQTKLKKFLDRHHFFDYLTDRDYPASLDRQTNYALSKHNLKQIHFTKKLPATLPADPLDFLALDLGGTYLRLYLCHYENSRLKIISQYKENFYDDKLYAPATLFDDLKQHLDRFLATVKVPPTRLIFSFANALRPYFRQSGLDGEILYWGKNHRQKNLIGLCLGLELENYLRKNGYPQMAVSVINDSALALLSTPVPAENSTSTVINLIVGSGTNISVGYDTEKGCKIINLEFGDFDFFPYSDFDRQLNYHSNIPDKFLTEKLFAGAWDLYLFRVILKQALLDKIFPAAAQFQDFKTMNAGDLENFFQPETSDFPSFDLLREIWQAMTARGAFICATGLHSILCYLQANHLAKNRVTISETGAVLKNSLLFRQTFENTLQELIKKNPLTSALKINLTMTTDPICPGIPKLLFLCA